MKSLKFIPPHFRVRTPQYYIQMAKSPTQYDIAIYQKKVNDFYSDYIDEINSEGVTVYLDYDATGVIKGCSFSPMSAELERKLSLLGDVPNNKG